MNNKKKQFSRITVLLMATTIALAGLAVGYGHWQDQLMAKVTTSTTIGQFTCFGFVQVSTDDPGPPPGNSVIDHTVGIPIYWYNQTYHQLGDEPGDPPAKDVAYTKAWKVNNSGDCGAEQISVLVENGYPSYASATFVGFKNFGPTAVTITAEGINLPADMVAAGYYLQYYSPAVLGVQHSKCYWLRKLVGPGAPNTPDPGFVASEAAPGDGNDNDGDGLVDEDPAVLDVCWENFEGEVLQPTDTTAGVLKQHVLQPAEQGAEYKFNVWVEVWPN